MGAVAVAASPEGVPGAVTDPGALQAEELTYPGAQGTPVNAYVVRPAAPGAHPAMIVIHEAANSGLTERAAGVKKILGSSGVQVLTIPNAKSDIPGTKAKVQAAFKANKSLDGFLGLDPDVTIPCLDVVPKGTKSGTFDVGGAIKEIEAGRLMFAIDQQQYLQGYLPVVFAMLYVTNLNTIGNGAPVLTRRSS